MNPYTCRRTSRIDWGQTICWLAILLAVTGVAGCEREKPPIQVGFAGGLTGRYSDLGTSGRNGVILAVEEWNAGGGINGRKIDLIVKDDQQDVETAIRVDTELILENVAAIIGHMTSAMTMAVLPLINQKKILLISPTTSTGQLSGQDDWFFRTVGTSIETPRKLAEYAVNKAGIAQMAACYDLENRTYSEGYVNEFRTRFQELGGRLTVLEAFTHLEDVQFDRLAQKLTGSGCEGVLIIAGGLDAAMICQQIRKINQKIKLFSSGWAMTQDFVQHGGHAATGVLFAEFFNWDSRDDAYGRFVDRYRNRFGVTPTFAAIYGYEAAEVLFNSLARNADPQSLKKTIIDQKTFRGLQGDFEIDAWGDARRHPYLITVSNGRFITVE